MSVTNARFDVWHEGEKTEFVVEGNGAVVAYPVEEGDLGWIGLPRWEADENAVEVVEELFGIRVVSGHGE